MSSTLRIRFIYDNREDQSGSLKSGWGLSCLIEKGNQKILFDTGGESEAFFRNSDLLNVPFEEITHLVFSHQHWDHTAGFGAVVNKLSKDAHIYLPKRFSRKFLRQLPEDRKIRIVDDFETIGEGVSSLVLKGGLFMYEQTLLIDTPKGVVVLTGCSHPGIVKIIQAARKKSTQPIYLVVGGFHLHRSREGTISAIIDQFQEFGVEKVAPCHCIGEGGMQQFQDRYGANFVSVVTGTILEI